jgi:hypothetical protein
MRAAKSLPMKDPLIEKARTDLAAIAEEIGRLQLRHRKLAAFLDAYDDAPQQELLPTEDEKDDPSIPGVSNKERVIRNAVQILSEMQPLHTRTLLQKLEERGITIGSTDKIIGLSSILSRDKQRFVASRSAGWSLKK